MLHLEAKFELKKGSLREEKVNGADFAFFEGYASTFGNIDRTADIVMRGAFKRCLERNKTIKMLWQHKFDTIIGQFPMLVEDEMGLFVQGRINMGTEKGREAYALLKAGDLDSMSIGYAVISDEYNRDLDVRMLKELELYEISLVTEPANELARITAVKGNVSTSASDILQDQGYQYDEQAVAQRVKGNEGQAYLWASADRNEHKFLIADLVDGKWFIIPEAVDAAAEQLKNYEELGLELADVVVMREALSQRYYKQVGKIEPWRIKGVDEIATVPDAETWLRGAKGLSSKEAKRFISVFKAVVLRERDANEAKGNLKERDAVKDLSKLGEVVDMINSIKQTLLRGN